MKYLLPMILFTTLFSWQGAILLSLCFLISGFLPKLPQLRTTKRYLADLSTNAQLRKVLQEPVGSTESKLDLISYRESLKYDKFSIRRNILSILAFHPTPENMRLIKEAAKNDDKVIRILARTALQQVENHWRKIIEKLEDRIKSLGDASLNSKRLLKNLYFRLGNVYEELIHSDMLQEKVQIEEGADPAKVSFIHNGINTEQFHYRERQVDSQTPKIGFIGRITQIKNIKGLMTIARRVCRELKEARFLLAGPTNEEEEYYLVFLIRLIQRFGYNKGPSLDWLKGSGLRIIYLNTLLLILTGMTDKLLYWFLSPHATEFLPGLSLFPEFDYAVFLTGLTLIPAIGYFHYFLDHGFHDHLFSYHASLEQGRGLIYLREQASKIYHIFLSCIGHLLLLHCVFAGLILVLFTFLFEYFSIGLQTIYLMKIASVNTVVQMAFQSSVLFLYYFNFQKESIRVNLGAFLTVLVVTLLMVQLPFEFTGFSFFLSIIPWTIFAFYKIERKLRSLTYYSISQSG